MQKNCQRKKKRDTEELRKQKLNVKKKLWKKKDRIQKLMGKGDTEELMQRLKEVESESKKFEDLANFLQGGDHETINVFCGGRYTNTMRHTCMKLLTECNIANEKLPKAIETVLGTLALNSALYNE